MQLAIPTAINNKQTSKRRFQEKESCREQDESARRWATRLMNCLRVINPWEQRTEELSQREIDGKFHFKSCTSPIRVLPRRGISARGRFVPLPLKPEIRTSLTCSSLASIDNSKLTPLESVNFRDPVVHSRANPKPRLTEATIRCVGAPALNNRGRLIFYLRELINLNVSIEFVLL